MHRELQQHGSLRIRSRVHGPGLWEFRYRSTDDAGKQKLKSVIVGRTDEFPTKRAMRASLLDVLQKIDGIAPQRKAPTMNTLIERFIEDEHLHRIAAGDRGHLLHYSTAKVYLLILNRYLRPRWGSTPLGDIRPLAIQQWLNGLTAAPKYKANIRGLLHRLYKKAMLWDLIDLQTNPIALVEVKGASRRRRRPTVLTVEQFHRIVGFLPEPQRTMVIVAQYTGLRVSELLALQWADFDFDNLTLQVSRGVVNGRVDEVKTEYSEDLLPLDRHLATLLLNRQKEAVPSAEGWVFANPMTLKPYNSSSMGKRHFRKIGTKLGIRLGWHTFRHTYRSWLDAIGAPTGVQQKLMRHADIATTMNTYGNALMDSKRDANSKIVRMALEAQAGSPALEMKQ